MANHPDTSAVYTNKFGMSNRITSFRCSESLRDRLFAYADSTNKDPSEVIREAIAEYLRNRNTRLDQNINMSLNGWSAKSTKV